MSAKVDNTAIQAGYPLYHHAFFLSEEGKWAVVQQGMSAEDRTARRYHWLSDHVKEFVVEPHEAIVGDTKRDTVLNMTAKESEECRKPQLTYLKRSPQNSSTCQNQPDPHIKNLYVNGCQTQKTMQSTFYLCPEESTGMHYAKLTSFNQETTRNY